MKFLSVVSTASALALVACSAPNDMPAAKADSEPAFEQPVATVAEPDAPAVGSNVLTSEGYGPLRIGMTQAEVDAVMGKPLLPMAADIDGCSIYKPERAPEGLSVRISQGVLTRVEITRPSTIKTEAGFAVGDSIDKVRAAYGSRGSWEVHLYDAGESGRLFVWDKLPEIGDTVFDREARGITYVVSDTGIVWSIYGGDSSIQAFEGCA